MSSSMASISRRLYRSLFTNPSSHFSIRFCSTLSSPQTPDDSTIEPDPNTESDSASPSSPSPSSSSNSTQRQTFFDRPLENGLDVGIYKAILVGQVGQTPLQKRLKSGRTVTLLSVGTGGIRNNRRPLDNEEPREYANRCAVQWHRVSIYPESSILYLEGNLETKIFTDPITGLVRRIREIAVRQNGRLVFLGKGDDAQQPTQGELRGVGYY
ncbi:hypothetical protein CsSME_00053919 [Camellia sinensis var. sinensis]